MRDMALMVLVAWIAGCCGSTAVTKVTIRERYDSLIVRHDTIRVRDARSDSLEILVSPSDSNAFTSVRASLDTTVSGVGLDVRYSYPPDAWSIDVAQRDTVIRWRVRDSLIERPYEVEVVPFWVKLALGLATLAMLGMIVALVKR